MSSLLRSIVVSFFIIHWLLILNEIVKEPNAWYILQIQMQGFTKLSYLKVWIRPHCFLKCENSYEYLEYSLERKPSDDKLEPLSNKAFFSCCN